MISASFVPYIIKLIAPKLTEKIANHLAKAFKLPQMFNYMELPNDADKRIDKLEAKVEILSEDQHPPAIDLEEWKEVKDIIKKLKNKKAFKSLNAK